MRRAVVLTICVFTNVFATICALGKIGVFHTPLSDFLIGNPILSVVLILAMPLAVMWLFSRQFVDLKVPLFAQYTLIIWTGIIVLSAGWMIWMYMNFHSGSCGIGSNITYDLNDTELTISGNGKIRSYAFAYDGFSEVVESVVIEEGITGVGNYAFSRCKNIKEVQLPNGMGLIGDGAFQGCSSLEAISCPEQLVSIGKNCFLDCTQLLTVELSDQIGIIPEGAFRGCSGMTSINLPDSIYTIQSKAFADSGLAGKVKLPKSLRSLEDDVFENCDAITKIQIASPELISVGDGAFKNCIAVQEISFSKEMEVDTWGDSVFESCVNLTSVAMPGDLKIIGKRTFYGCASLTDVQLPETLERVGKSAFEGCAMLKSIVFPESVKKIERHALKDCGNLREVRFYGNMPDIVGKDVFKNHRTSFTVFCPVGNASWEKQMEKDAGTKYETFSVG